MSKGLLVIPVFYKVVPSHVRHHKGSYGDAFVKHEERFPKNKLQKWKEALRQVANLSGYEFKEEYTYEYKFIERIVTSVSEKINHPASSSVVNYSVGLKSLVEEVMKVLDVGPDVAYMIGIHGVSGVGKSRLARAVYNNLIYQNFDGSCFLENMKEESNKHGLPHLQSILLQEILKDMTIKVTSCWHLGVSTIHSKLQVKKVLLVLDDVDKYEQLQAILGTPYWFGPSSRVIITTQNVELLNPNNAQIRYEMKKLNEKYTLQMHTWKASEKQKADQAYAVEMNRFSSRPMNFSSYTQHFPVFQYTQPFPVSSYTQHFPVNQFSPLVHSNSFFPFNTTSTFSQQLTVIQHPPSCSMAPCTFSSCPAHNTFF